MIYCTKQRFTKRTKYQPPQYADQTWGYLLAEDFMNTCFNKKIVKAYTVVIEEGNNEGNLPDVMQLCPWYEAVYHDPKYVLEYRAALNLLQVHRRGYQ